jgi:hypothetical protein
VRRMVAAMETSGALGVPPAEQAPSTSTAATRPGTRREPSADVNT